MDPGSIPFVPLDSILDKIISLWFTRMFLWNWRKRKPKIMKIMLSRSSMIRLLLIFPPNAWGPISWEILPSKTSDRLSTESSYPNRENARKNTVGWVLTNITISWKLWKRRKTLKLNETKYLLMISLYVYMTLWKYLTFLFWWKLIYIMPCCVVSEGKKWAIIFCIWSDEEGVGFVERDYW